MHQPNVSNYLEGVDLNNYWSANLVVIGKLMIKTMTIWEEKMDEDFFFSTQQSITKLFAD